MSAALEISDLRVVLGGRDILRRVQFSARPGETIALLGGSGTGKSVTLKAILGLLPATAHCLFLDYQQVPPGQDLRALPYSCVVYEVGNRELALDWLARGADKIETYCIGELLET